MSGPVDEAIMRLMQLGVMCAAGVLTLGIGVAPDARAANTTCENAEFLLPGSIAVVNITFSTSRYYKVPVVAGRSYSFTSWAPFQDKGDGNFSAVHSFYTDNACATPASMAAPSPSEPNPTLPDGLHQGDHRSIIPDFTGILYVKVFSSASVSLHSRVAETTLFSPWWFTGGTNQAFVEIRNTTSWAVAYWATFSESDGSTCGVTGGFVQANGNTAISVGAVGTCAASSGSAQLAFHGQLNALVANITTIDGVQATSFDAPFKGRMEWGTWKR